MVTADVLSYQLWDYGSVTWGMGGIG